MKPYQQKVFSHSPNVKNIFILVFFLSFPHCLLTTLTFSMAILDLFLLKCWVSIQIEQQYTGVLRLLPSKVIFENENKPGLAALMFCIQGRKEKH